MWCHVRDVFATSQCWVEGRGVVVVGFKMGLFAVRHAGSGDEVASSAWEGWWRAVLVRRHVGAGG